MGKKLGLDDKYKILQGYKPAPRVRSIDPGLVGGTMGALGPKGRISTLSSALGPKGRISTLSAGRPAGMSKIKKLGIIGTGSVAAGAVMGPSMKKDYDEMTSSDSFKKGREEGAAKAKSQMDDMYNKLGKITGYITGKMYGGSAKKYKKGGMSMKDKKIKKVMGEFKKGELNIGKSKKKVKSKKQAIAIALAEARKKKA